MFRDIEHPAPIEADHIVGDMIRRRSQQGEPAVALPALRTAYTHLKTYEGRQRREHAPPSSAMKRASA
jgi:2-dehydropantoate 2-reductase